MVWLQVQPRSASRHQAWLPFWPTMSKWQVNVFEADHLLAFCWLIIRSERFFSDGGAYLPEVLSELNRRRDGNE